MIKNKFHLLVISQKSRNNRVVYSLMNMKHCDKFLMAYSLDFDTPLLFYRQMAEPRLGVYFLVGMAFGLIVSFLFPQTLQSPYAKIKGSAG